MRSEAAQSRSSSAKTQHTRLLITLRTRRDGHRHSKRGGHIPGRNCRARTLRGGAGAASLSERTPSAEYFLSRPRTAQAVDGAWSGQACSIHTTLGPASGAPPPLIYAHACLLHLWPRLWRLPASALGSGWASGARARARRLRPSRAFALHPRYHSGYPRTGGAAAAGGGTAARGRRGARARLRGIQAPASAVRAHRPQTRERN